MHECVTQISSQLCVYFSVQMMNKWLLLCLLWRYGHYLTFVTFAWGLGAAMWCAMAWKVEMHHFRRLPCLAFQYTGLKKVWHIYFVDLNSHDEVDLHRRWQFFIPICRIKTVNNFWRYYRASTKISCCVLGQWKFYLYQLYQYRVY